MHWAPILAVMMKLCRVFLYKPELQAIQFILINKKKQPDQALSQPCNSQPPSPCIGLTSDLLQSCKGAPLLYLALVMWPLLSPSQLSRHAPASVAIASSKLLHRGRARDVAQTPTQHQPSNTASRSRCSRLLKQHACMGCFLPQSFPQAVERSPDPPSHPLTEHPQTTQVHNTHTSHKQTEGPFAPFYLSLAASSPASDPNLHRPIQFRRHPATAPFLSVGGLFLRLAQPAGLPHAQLASPVQARGLGPVHVQAFRKRFAGCA